MRIANRIRRLEQRDDTGDRMTADEIAIAAAEFKAKIADMAARPPIMAPEEAIAGWHAIVTAPGPGWWQRTFAKAELEDWSL